MKKFSIAVLIALAAIGGAFGASTAWAGSDEATSPGSIQAP